MNILKPTVDEKQQGKKSTSERNPVGEGEWVIETCYAGETGSHEFLSGLFTLEIPMRQEEAIYLGRHFWLSLVNLGRKPCGWGRILWVVCLQRRWWWEDADGKYLRRNGTVREHLHWRFPRCYVIQVHESRKS